MNIAKHIQLRLRENLLAILSSNHKEKELNGFVAVCHALAYSFLQKKISYLNVSHPLLGLSQSDIAYDCIAELFHRNEQGKYFQLESYFASLSIEQVSDAELLSHLRRLVCSKVNNNLYRMYFDADPINGKILRNIKVAITALSNFVYVERYGEVYLVPSLVNPCFHLPLVEQETLLTELRTQIRRTEFIPELLGKLSVFLRNQQTFSKVIPLIEVVRLIRTIYCSDFQLVETSDSAESQMLINDAERIIRAVCSEKKNELKLHYVEKGKTTERVFDEYFIAVERYLILVLLRKDGYGDSLYETLQSMNPMLTPKEYKKQHKNILEYLSRETKVAVTERLKKEM
ncbi:MAG: hypothetical protein HYZ34_10620 [Ignavibacteriae bacterium]|nr:hypothetical protein [Ignavibacteriota bacterium]